MTSTWGKPIIGTTIKASGNYLPKVGEKVKITFQKQNFMIPPREWIPEEYVINELKAKFGETEHWEILYIKVMVKQKVWGLNFWDAWGEIHLKATQALTIAIAIAYVIVVVGIIFGVTLAGTFIYASYRFVEFTKGWGGIVIVLLIFLIIITFIGSLEVGKGKFKIAKGV